MALLAASGGDTVKLFDISVDSGGDPCTQSYAPSPGFQVNSLKWNHTNLVVASAGDDKKITLWRQNGRSIGSLSNSGDNIEEDISCINFSNKSSRYLCSGGSGQVVRIWDLQRKCCIKRLRGHNGSISGAMYNCKDDHLASISINGDIIVHNLASGRAAELKDPHGQMLRVLDYSRASRHLLATAGDDGSLHMWDTAGRSLKASWLKQHSAPTAGLSFSPSNDKIIASVGLDKKLYTFDSGMKKPTFCISYEAPFSSMAFRDNGWMLAAGTSNGRVVFYDVRGKPRLLTTLRAYGNSEAVTSLCWQRSKPIVVNEKNCTDELALLWGAVQDSVVMPDPLPSATLSNVSQTTTFGGPGRSICSTQSSSSTTTSSELLTNLSSAETPHKNSLVTGRILPRLQALRTFADDMNVFSPPVDVQPTTPSLDKLWNEPDESKKVQTGETKTSVLFPNHKSSLPQGVNDKHPILDWEPNRASKQDDIDSAFPGSTSSVLSRADDPSSISPRDKFTFHHEMGSLSSTFSLPTSGSFTNSSFSVSKDLSSASHPTMGYSTGVGLLPGNLRPDDISCGQETSPKIPGHVPFSFPSQANPESTGQSSLNISRRSATYTERTSTASSFTDAHSASFGSPKTKKTGAETREEFPNSSLSRSDTSTATETRMPPPANGPSSLHEEPSQGDLLQGTSSFTLQLFQRTLGETLASFQRSIHEDVRSLHIEVLRQFHLQEMEMSTALNSIMDNQAALLKEIQDLRKENERLRQLI